MSEAMNPNQNQNPDAGEPAVAGKTFSQDDVNRIVGERLAKERAKADAAAAEREKQLAAREMRLTAKETLNEKGLPGYLVDALDYTSEETMKKGLELIEKAVLDSKPKTEIKCIGSNVEGEHILLPGAKPFKGWSPSLHGNEEESALRSAFGLK